MQIQVSTRHGSLSDITRGTISTKVEKLTRLFERLTSIEVTVDLERQESPRVEILASAKHKHDFVANAAGEDLMATVDQAVRKVEQQVRKHKEKIQEHHRQEHHRGNEED